MKTKAVLARAAVALSAAVLSSATLAAPPRVESLAWMAGTWVHEDGPVRVAESWLGPGNGLMVAANLSTFPGCKRTFEFLRITDTDTGFSYYASPGGRAPVEFRMKETGEMRVVFENPEHDFPRRILYWREGDALFARIEGTLKGKDASEQWRFTRR